MMAVSKMYSTNLLLLILALGHYSNGISTGEVCSSRLTTIGECDENCLSTCKDTECFTTLTRTKGLISYTKIADNITKTCQIMLDISPYQKLRIGLLYNPCGNNTDPQNDYYRVTLFNIYQVNPENENSPLGNTSLKLTRPNGTMYELEGSLFVIDYYDYWEIKENIGVTFVLSYEAIGTPVYSPIVFRTNFILNPQTSLIVPTGALIPTEFTTWLIRGPVHDNYHSCYLKNMKLQLMEWSESCEGSCILTLTELQSSIGNSRVRSFYTPSEYAIGVKSNIFGPCVVTFKFRGNTNQTSPKFELRWSYLS